MKRIAATVAALALAAVIVTGAAADVPDDVKTLVQRKCAGCHKGKSPSGGLNLEPANLAAVVGAPSRKVAEAKIVDPQAPEASYLLKKVRREKDIAGRPMPPGQALTAEEIRALEAWIAGLK